MALEGVGLQTCRVHGVQCFASSRALPPSLVTVAESPIKLQPGGLNPVQDGGHHHPPLRADEDGEEGEEHEEGGWSSKRDDRWRSAS